MPSPGGAAGHSPTTQGTENEGNTVSRGADSLFIRKGEMDPGQVKQHCPPKASPSQW